jgi:uncharacterized protein (TIGR03083 family)
MDYQQYCAQTGAEITRMSQLTTGVTPETPVPGCPEWTLARLIKHTGIVHRWCAAIVATRATGPIAQSSLDVALPADPNEYPAWLAAGAAPLVTVLLDAGPDMPIWTWAGERDTSWWARRMLHETIVHRADAELSVGVTPEVDPAAAADGIGEFLTIARLGTRPSKRLAELPSGQTIHLHATDDGLGEGGEWLISMADGDFTWTHGHAKGTVAVRGPAAVLLLLTYGRVRPDDERLTVFGDQSLLAAWQDIVTL